MSLKTFKNNTLTNTLSSLNVDNESSSKDLGQLINKFVNENDNEMSYFDDEILKKAKNNSHEINNNNLNNINKSFFNINDSEIEKKNYRVTNENNENLEKKIDKNNKTKLPMTGKILEIKKLNFQNLNNNNNDNIDLKENLMDLVYTPEKNRENRNINENSTCGEKLSFTIKDLFDYEKNKKYIEIKCPKCRNIQNITISCFYSDENNNKFQLNFNLISPLALLKEPWFKNYNVLDKLLISQDYPEEYLSTLFYFYEQGLPYNFLIPNGMPEQELKEEQSCKYNNLEPVFDYDEISKTYRNKKKFVSLYSPNITKRDINYHERIKNFDFKREGKEVIKSPSPKKSSFAKRKNALKKLKTIEDNKKKVVTFSCFKK
jgi:hypothetical protein